MSEQGRLKRFKRGWDVFVFLFSRWAQGIGWRLSSGTNNDQTRVGCCLGHVFMALFGLCGERLAER